MKGAISILSWMSRHIGVLHVLNVVVSSYSGTTTTTTTTTTTITTTRGKG